jgi:hypothetical protein
MRDDLGAAWRPWTTSSPVAQAASGLALALPSWLLPDSLGPTRRAASASEDVGNRALALDARSGSPAVPARLLLLCLVSGVRG